MNNNNFEQLVASVQEGGAILRGKVKPSRTFEFNPSDVKDVRTALHLSQIEFAQMIGVSVSLSITLFHQKATSSVVNGEPSEYFMPLRM